MRRTLFLLLFYFCLTITVGKQVRALCAQFLTGKTSATKTLVFDIEQSPAGNEETDSEDSEITDADNDDHELTDPQVLQAAERSRVSFYYTSQIFKDHLEEIGTPPPRS